jgi:hypothetical protein
MQGTERRAPRAFAAAGREGPVNVTVTATDGLSAVVVALLGILGFFARQFVKGELLPRAYFDDIRADRDDLRADRDMWKEAYELSEAARRQSVEQVGHLARGVRVTGNALEKLPSVVAPAVAAAAAGAVQAQGGPDVAETA